MILVDQDLHLNVERIHQALAVMKLSGVADFHTAPILRTGGVELIDQGHRHLVIDLSQVTFCDSAGLNALINIWNTASRAGGSMTLSAVPDKLQRILALTGLDTALTTYSTTEEALAAGSATPSS
jgi:anti-sigma B factor antagonist